MQNRFSSTPPTPLLFQPFFNNTVSFGHTYYRNLGKGVRRYLTNRSNTIKLAGNLLKIDKACEQCDISQESPVLLFNFISLLQFFIKGDLLYNLGKISSI